MRLLRENVSVKIMTCMRVFLRRSPLKVLSNVNLVSYIYNIHNSYMYEYVTYKNGKNVRQFLKHMTYDFSSTKNQPYKYIILFFANDEIYRRW